MDAATGLLMPSCRIWLLVSQSAALCLAASNTSVRLPVREGTGIRFAHVSLDEGPSRNSIKAITEDDQGFVWVGTQDGLKRYDGYHFRDYRHRDGDTSGPSGIAVTTLLKDRSGSVWVGSDWFLDRYDPTTERFIPYCTASGDPMRFGDGVNHLDQDSAGTIWVSSVVGLFGLNPVSGKLLHYDRRVNDSASLSGNNVKSVFEEKDGTFWVATTEGLDVFDRRSGTVKERIPLVVPSKSATGTAIPRLRGDSPIRILADHAGVLWVIFPYEGGLARLDRKAGRLIPYTFTGASPDNYIDAINEDREGSLWLGSSHDGLLKLDADRKEVVRYRNNPIDPDSMSADQVQTMFEDPEGNVWVGTQGGDINRFAPRAPPFKRYRHEPGNPNSLEKDEVTSVYEDSQGILWVGNRVALNRIDRKSGQYKIYRTAGGPGELSNTYVISIAEDRSGYLWFGTSGGGLNRFDRRTGEFKVYRHDPADPNSLSDDLVYSLFVDHEGALWIGTDNGLDRFDPATERFYVFRPADPAIGSERAITEDAAGRLWMVTVVAGLHRFDPGTGHFTLYRHSSAAGSLSTDWANAVCVDHLGNVWVGTQTGLNRLDTATGRFRVYDERDGLPNRNVTGILEDRKGSLWIGTNKGLSRFNPQAGTFTNYYVSDGLSGNEFYRRNGVSKNRYGEMFFSSTGGLTAFFPDQVIENSYVPPVVLTDFLLADNPVHVDAGSVLRQSISVTRKLTLNPKQNIFTFEFSSLSYADPNRNRYRYRLEPLETAWKERDSSHRTVTYTTLPPGEYTFRVQGSNNRGTWNYNGANVQISILPPWWATWTFRVTGALSMLAILLCLHYYRLRHIARELNVRFEERVGERTRIARDLHDTLLQSFQGVLLKFSALGYKLPENSEVRADLEEVIDQARDAITEGRDAVQGLRTSTMLSNDLARSIGLCGEGLAREQGVANPAGFRLQVEGESRDLPPLVRDEVYRTAVEALRNAFRHSEATQIEVEIRYDARRFTLRVRDNGKGIDPRVLESGGRTGHHGLPGMRERASLAGGLLAVWSKPGAGTEIELTISAAIAYRKVTLPHAPRTAS